VLFGLAVGAAVPLAQSADAAITRPFTPTYSVNLAPGISYTKGTMKTTGGRKQSVRVGTVNPSHPQVSLRALLSNDKVVGKERPSHLARRKSRNGKKAMIATNGDRSVFGKLNAYAAPHSMHVSGGELFVSQPCMNPTLGIDRSGGVRIDNVRVEVTGKEDDRNVPKRIHRVNTHRDDAKVVLFTRRFGPSTKTKAGGTEVVLTLPHMLKPSDSQRLKVLYVRRGGGNTTLRDGQAVLSMKGPNNDWVKRLKKGDWLTVATMYVRQVDKPCGGTIARAHGWGDVVEAMGGNHFSARNGAIKVPSASAYREGAQRHPRTNVGVTADGRVLMVTVDGRRPGYSIGVTLKEMGQLMRSLGATDAFNLDGGGSTVMARRFLGSGSFKVTNRPSDGSERVHSQALAAFQLLP
jgi:hypothetical protein